MKLHVSMIVEDFDRALGFYSDLFGEQPVIVRENYAKWDVADPAVNFVIEPVAGRNRALGVNHLGIQVAEDDELNALVGRIRDSGQPFVDVQRASCCYAQSDKAWIRGVGNEKWEAFLTHSHDGEEYGDDTETGLEEIHAGAGDAACCVDSCCPVDDNMAEPAAPAP